MSLKSELLIYSSALEAFDKSDLPLALEHFAKISETSKIQWNMGIILASMGRHNEAIARFGESVVMDQYLVVGWFQRGVSYFMVGMYALAVKDFDMAFQHMRGNQTINHTQLGLAHSIHSAEILFNLGLSKIYMGQTAAGMIDLRRAQEQKIGPEHQVIDDCIRDHGKGYNMFSVPAGKVFRPSDSKMKNIKTRDYMGKAILISATDANEEYTTFTGITRLERGQTPKGVPLDPSHPISRSISRSRSRAELSRSASVSNLRQPDATIVLPIAERMAASSASTKMSDQKSSRPPVSPGLGLTRNLTISNPDPTTPRSPMGHARSHTIDSPRSTEYNRNDISPRVAPDGRPTRPRIVIPDVSPAEWDPRSQSDRYPHFQNDRSKLKPPSSYLQASSATRSTSSPGRSPMNRPRHPTQDVLPLRARTITRSADSAIPHSQAQEILETPKDRFEGLEEIYDDYHSPTPDLIVDSPELPYTAIGQAFTGVSPLSRSNSKQLPNSFPQGMGMTRMSSTRSNGRLIRSNTNQSNNGPGYGYGQGQGQGQGQGLMLTVEDANVQSPGLMDLIKIRIKVHVGTDTRGMSILPTDTYAHLVSQLSLKFPELHRKSQGQFNVCFRDEDGDMLSMQDEGDFEAAVDVARVMSQGRADGKLEIWVE